MPKEKYVSLEKSALWQEIEDYIKETKGYYATKLHRLERLAFQYGTGHAWSEGRLVDTFAVDVEIFDAPHEVSKKTLGEDPAKNPLFTSTIPSIPADQFLKELSANPSTHSKDKRVNCDRNVELNEYAGTNVMPLNIDLHYLAALMTVLKHLHLHPERLDTHQYAPHRNKQRTFVKRALNTGFDIIRQRGLEENFTRACQELAEKMPGLTAFSQTYVQKQDEHYKREVEFKKTLEAPLHPEAIEFLRSLSLWEEKLPTHKKDSPKP